MPEKEVRVILGTMMFGSRLNFDESKAMTDDFFDFQRNGQTELDTAYVYANGKSEEFIGKFELRNNSNIEIATKANPVYVLDAAGVRMQLETSLKRLQLKNVYLFYLHGPDHKTPIIETLNAVNDLYNEKKFKEFGLSNYAAWQVAEICTICKNNGWVQPTVYQGMYNALTRNVEKELFKCLRYFNIRFYAYNPLAGGLLTGKYEFEDSAKSGSGRFFGKQFGQMYQHRYWRQEMFNSIKNIKKALNDRYSGDVTITEASLRWLCHHSKLDGSCGDGVIIGASTMNQYKENIKHIIKGPLDENIVNVFDNCWKECYFSCYDYMR